MLGSAKKDLYRTTSGLDYGFEMSLEVEENDLIDAVDRYLKVNYYELYNRNSLAVIFEKAREDKEVGQKMFNTIRKFIIH